jgi:hypothetical protein
MDPPSLAPRPSPPARLLVLLSLSPSSSCPAKGASRAVPPLPLPAAPSCRNWGDFEIEVFEVSGRRSHGGAEARRKQREEATTGHKGNWRVPCSCLCVETPAVAHSPQVFYTAPVIYPVRVHKCPWQTS